MKSLEYDPDIILPSDINVPIDDKALEELEWRLTTADALAEVLERACEAEHAPGPHTIGLVLGLLGECFLESALTAVFTCFEYRMGVGTQGESDEGDDHETLLDGFTDSDIRGDRQCLRILAQRRAS
jgi:hypothetical protein